MKKIKESNRIKEIENKLNKSIESILYKWHWKDNLVHKEIGKKLKVPRPTITRWFKQLGVPSQSCTRFTNNNRPSKKPKPPKKPHFRFPVNENFFKNWSPEMAYILGYFTADGYMFVNPGNSYYVAFVSTDYELISNVREILRSEHKINRRKYENPKWKVQYRLQIGSKKMFQDLLNLGLMPNKSKKVKLPSIPKSYFGYFSRGYFDGDGCVNFGFYQKKDRKKLSSIFITRFTSGNKKFLKDLLEYLKMYAGIKGGSLFQKQNKSYDLAFSVKDSFKLYKLMYQDVKENRFLKRKYNIFQKAIKYYAGVA